MTTINIGALHNNISNPPYTRQSGRTLTMCVEILQQSEFLNVNDTIYIYAGSKHRAEWLKGFLWQIAVDMEYESIENRKQWELWVNGVRLLFGHKKPPFGYPPCIEYFDHDYAMQEGPSRRF